MPLPEDVLTIARSQLFTVESPANSNKTKYGVWYGLNGEPWCAQFVSWVFFHAGLPLPASTAKGFAYTPAGAAWFQKNKRFTGVPSPGHVVFYDFPGDGVNRISHVGIVEKVNSNGTIVAIEGNTSPGNGGSQRDGGGVYRRVRKVGIVGYGRPVWSAVPAPQPPINLEDDEMIEYLELEGNPPADGTLYRFYPPFGKAPVSSKSVVGDTFDNLIKPLLDLKKATITPLSKAALDAIPTLGKST